MRKLKRISFLSGIGMVATMASIVPTMAVASMGNLATTYGILPTDVATSQSLSMFSNEISSIYYNPGYVSTDAHGELTVGGMRAEPNLDVKSFDENSPLERRGSFKEPSSQILLGMKSNLTTLTKYQHPAYLGVMIGVEKLGNEMLAFTSESSESGQFFHYGRQPLFLIVGGGTTLWRGISAGASMRVTLHASADMDATLQNFSGETHDEKLSVNAKPRLAPIVGVNIDWAETLCSSQDCLVEGFETGLTYRRYSNSHTAVNANVMADQLINEPMPLNVMTLDSYQPDIYSAGLVYSSPSFKDHRAGSFRLGGTVDFQQWSQLNKELKKNTIMAGAVNTADKDQRLELKDITIPRVGAEVWVHDMMKLSTGLSYSPTPLKSQASVDVNYLDADKLIAGVGATFQFDHPPVFDYPLSVNVGYQFHKLDSRKYDIYSSKEQYNNPLIDRVKTDGTVHVVSGAITLKF